MCFGNLLARFLGDDESRGSDLPDYILHRDDHECQNPACAHLDKPKPLQVHHLGYWQGDHSDRPDNLITLCVFCHTPANHQPGGFLYGWQPKLKSFRPETFIRRTIFL